jgi:hypothetical protein
MKGIWLAGHLLFQLLKDSAPLSWLVNTSDRCKTEIMYINKDEHIYNLCIHISFLISILFNIKRKCTKHCASESWDENKSLGTEASNADDYRLQPNTEGIMQWTTKVLRENLLQCCTIKSQIPNRLLWDSTSTFVVRSQQMTAWTMTQLLLNHINIWVTWP